MRYSIYMLIAFSGLLLFNASCSKPFDMVPDTVDTVMNLLPKMVIVNDPSSSYTSVFSIKYDTANHKIEAYADDTTNSTPYDVLALTHTFNNSGYLVAIDNIYFDDFEEIHRTPNNNIAWIRTTSPSDGSLDTTFYQYQQSNGNTLITTVKKFYYAGVLQSSGSATSTYNSNYNLIQVTDINGDNRLFTYNANGSINKITYQGPGISYQEDYFYTSGIPDGTADQVLQVFMGRDWYIENLRGVYPFNVLDYPSLSGTDPYHVSRVLDTENGATTEDRLYSYQFTSNNLISKITLNFQGSPVPSTYEFRY